MLTMLGTNIADNRYKYDVKNTIADSDTDTDTDTDSERIADTDSDAPKVSPIVSPLPAIIEINLPVYHKMMNIMPMRYILICRHCKSLYILQRI